MNVEDTIKDVITQKLNDGTVETLISQAFEETLKNALHDIFSWGKAKKTIEDKINEVMVPYLEKYDYSGYITKLDTVLTDIINNTDLTANNDILENFKLLMLPVTEGTFAVTDLFKRYCKYVAENVDTQDLEVCFDDGVSYEDVLVEFDVEPEENKYEWYTSAFDRRRIVLTCAEDENLNTIIPIERFKESVEKGFILRISSECAISSLRFLDDFQLLLLRLERAGTKIILDKECDTEYVTPDKEPEPTFS